MKSGIELQEKSKFKRQLKVKLKKFKTNDLFTKDVHMRGPNSIENRDKIKEHRFFKVN
jgi:hypothetical protein